MEGLEYNKKALTNTDKGFPLPHNLSQGLCGKSEDISELWRKGQKSNGIIIITVKIVGSTHGGNFIPPSSYTGRCLV